VLSCLDMDANTPEEAAFLIDPTAPATLAAAVLEESKGVTPTELLVSVGDNIAVQEENYLKCALNMPLQSPTMFILEFASAISSAFITRTVQRPWDDAD
jgi:hypothetical protein